MNEETDWTFESIEQVHAFMLFFSRLPLGAGRYKDLGPAIQDAHNPLRVWCGTYTTRRVAQAFQFGWMARAEAGKGPAGDL